MTCRILIAVPTFRRNDDLRELLPMLVAQADAVRAAGPYGVRVVIVDNDPDGGARPVVECSPGVEYVHEPHPGLAAVRNAALRAGVDADLLAFMDDDGRPSDGWLLHLVTTWERSGAAAVAGRVVEDYQSEPPAWIVAGGFFRRFDLPTLTVVPIAATTNLLLDLGQVRRLGLTFDPRFGLAGGEDTMFTRELTRLGAQIVWCNESVVHDRVPTSRLTRQWVLARSRSHGNTRALIALLTAPSGASRLAARTAYLGQGSLRLGWGMVKAALGTVRGRADTNATGLRTAHRGLGMLAGAVGTVVQEYAREPAGHRVDVER